MTLRSFANHAEIASKVAKENHFNNRLALSEAYGMNANNSNLKVVASYSSIQKTDDHDKDRS